MRFRKMREYRIFYYFFCYAVVLCNWFRRSTSVLFSEEAQETLTLSWRDITCSIETKTGPKIILQSISGEAKPGRLVAILGPSGSGKTTLLNCLSGHLPYSRKQKLVGSILINGKIAPIDPASRNQAYVTQDDLFYSGLTVEETLLMQAKLRLSRDMHDLEKEVYVNQIMAKLGLGKVRGSLIGDKKLRGISGGERKRLSLACELIGSPSLIFADEPTSGLDATQAYRVVNSLKALVKEGKTVMMSIHQPRGSIFELFDDIILLSEEGELVYQGPAQEALKHFKSLGFAPSSANVNPAEWLLDLVSLDASSPELERSSRSKVRKLARSFAFSQGGKHPLNGHWAQGSKSALAQLPEKVVRRQRPPFIKQIRLLFIRSWNQIIRSKAAIIAKAISNVMSGLIFGAIFYKLGYKQSNIMDRSGLLQVAVINTAMSSVMGTLNSFPRERTIVARERGKSAYSIGAYFISKLLAELPINALFPNLFGFLLYKLTNLNNSPGRLRNFLGALTLESFTSSALGLAVGALTPTPEAALAVGPSLMTLFILFSGFYITSDNIPSALKWIEKISIIKWGFEALSVNEFKGAYFEANNKMGANIKSGEDVLQRLAFGKSTFRSALVGQTRVLVGCYLLTYASLKLNKPKFQPLEEKTQERQTSQKSQDSSDSSLISPRQTSSLKIKKWVVPTKP